MSLQTKLTFLLFALSLVIIVAMGIVSTIVIDNYFHSRIVNELMTQARLIEYFIQTSIENDLDGYSKLQKFSQSANLRLTLIDDKGTVHFESDLPYNQLATIENHLHRPEVQQAIKEGIGTSTRHSATVDSVMLYLAKKLSAILPQHTGYSDVKILRVSVPLTQVQEIMRDIQSKITITSIIVLAFILGLAYLASKRFAKPIKMMAVSAEQIHSGNLKSRIPKQTTSEFNQLADTLNSMVDKLEDDIEKLKKLECVRSEFLGNVSHELRTPIFTIQGMLETLLEGAIDDKTVNRDFVERALKNINRLNVLLSDLIEISRIESGDMKLSFRYFDLQEFLTQIVSEMQESANRGNITLDFKPQPIKNEIYGDRDRLKQVIVNLIDNAIKYNKPNGRITISYENVDSGLRIIVSDSGVGIAPEHLPRIFERFYRVDKERSREAGGTGLGLAIVKHIIEAHGSRVEVQSAVGKGSEFSFILKS